MNTEQIMNFIKDNALLETNSLEYNELHYELMLLPMDRNISDVIRLINGKYKAFADEPEMENDFRKSCLHLKTPSKEGLCTFCNAKVPDTTEKTQFERTYPNRRMFVGGKGADLVRLGYPDIDDDKIQI